MSNANLNSEEAQTTGGNRQSAIGNQQSAIGNKVGNTLVVAGA